MRFRHTEDAQGAVKLKIGRYNRVFFTDRDLGSYARRIITPIPRTIMAFKAMHVEEDNPFLSQRSGLPLVL